MTKKFKSEVTTMITTYTIQSGEPLESFETTLMQLSTIKPTPEMVPKLELPSTDEKRKITYHVLYEGKYNLKYYNDKEKIIIDTTIKILKENKNVFEIVIDE